MKNVIALIIGFFSLNTFAAPQPPKEPDYTKIFQDKSACFILYDVAQHKIISEYNPTECAKRLSPCSTFKIPLSLMAFDQKIITQQTVFKWDGVDKGMAQWNQNQTPYTWFKNSVVWVSQSLTPQLSLRNIKYYLRAFNYGNQNFSGDPYQNNGLTHAWLNSSLKISGDEQLEFMKGLVNNSLPVSQDAMSSTMQNMYIESGANNTQLYGKTGSAGDLGWFIGYTQKSTQKTPNYIFILNFVDLKPNSTAETGGARAKKAAKTILASLGLF